MNLLLALTALLQINVGSDGSDGAFAFVADAGDPNVMTIDLGLAADATWNSTSPVAGQGVYDATEWAVVFKYTNVTVPTGKTVTFTNHPTRAPVVWLSQGDIIVDGELDLDGDTGHAAHTIPTWAEPGPGGARGGRGTLVASGGPGSAGFGPGGAFHNSNPTNGGSSAGHALDGEKNNGGEIPGKAYGAPELTRLIGGSGGASAAHPGASNTGGGAGGGAILLASNTTIRVTGSIHADGGDHGSAPPGVARRGGEGSGGALRCVADTIELSSTVAVTCLGSQYASVGRVRLEANVHSLAVPSIPLAHLARPTAIFPPPGTPTVAVFSVDAQPLPADPTAALDNLYADLVTTGDGVKNVVIRGMFVPDQTPVELRLTDSTDDAIVYVGTLSAAGQPVNQTEATIAVTFPASTVTLQARAVLD